MVLALVGLVCALGLSRAKSAPGSRTAAQNSQTISVPFVGCASDGQVGPRPAPTGAPREVRIDPEAARELAYYSAGASGGVLGPRGWHCFGSYGSSGSSLFVAPAPITSADVLSTTWGGLTGPAIQVSLSVGDTSGRFTVAAVIERIFPTHVAFAQSVIGEGFEPASDFPSGPYPKDRLTRRSDQVVEFQTPPNTQGLGVAHTRLQANGDPIAGVAILTGPTPDLVLAAVRLSRARSGLAPAIIQQLERDSAANANTP
jgi:hypothetical protein